MAQVRMSMPNGVLKAACELDFNRIKTEESRHIKKNRNGSNISASIGAGPTSHRYGNVTEILTSNTQIRVPCGAIDESIMFDIQGSKLRMSSRPEKK